MKIVILHYLKQSIKTNQEITKVLNHFPLGIILYVFTQEIVNNIILLLSFILFLKFCVRLSFPFARGQNGKGNESYVRADDDADFNPCVNALLDDACHTVDEIVIVDSLCVARERLARELEQHAPVFHFCHKRIPFNLPMFIYASILYDTRRFVNRFFQIRSKKGVLVGFAQVFERAVAA